MAFHPSDSPVLNISMLLRLREAGGQFLPLDLLGENLEQVRAELDALSAFGFQIERHPYQGAAYRGPCQRLCPDQLEHGLATSRIGRRIAVWHRVASTNDLAARAAGTLANDGLVVLAEEQTAGRGQRGRRWSVPPQSSILLSVLLFPPLELLHHGQDSTAGRAWLTALGAVATAEMVSDWTGCPARIKWPNDVRVEGRKLAGILVEQVRGPAADSTSESGRRSAVVIGIGLNGNIDSGDFPSELRSMAVSLSMLMRAKIDRSEIARDLIRRLDAWYDDVLRQGVSALGLAWRDRSEHLERLVRVTTPEGAIMGSVIDLNLTEGLTLVPSSIHEDHPQQGASKKEERVQLPLGKVLSLNACTTDSVRPRTS